MGLLCDTKALKDNLMLRKEWYYIASHLQVGFDPPTGLPIISKFTDSLESLWLSVCNGHSRTNGKIKKFLQTGHEFTDGWQPYPPPCPSNNYISGANISSGTFSNEFTECFAAFSPWLVTNSICCNLLQHCWGLYYYAWWRDLTLQNQKRKMRSYIYLVNI